MLGDIRLQTHGAAVPLWTKEKEGRDLRCQSKEATYRKLRKSRPAVAGKLLLGNPETLGHKVRGDLPIRPLPELPYLVLN